jgi:hypothetical protein
LTAEFQQVLSSLTPEEQAAIARLQEIGFDLPNVVQCFLAAEKDEGLAANLLLEK